MASASSASASAAYSVAKVFEHRAKNRLFRGTERDELVRMAQAGARSTYQLELANDHLVETRMQLGAEARARTQNSASYTTPVEWDPKVDVREHVEKIRVRGRE